MAIRVRAWKRLGWFVGLWAAGVAAMFAVTFGLRALFGL